jgi:hypothetical protein
MHDYTIERVLGTGWRLTTEAVVIEAIAPEVKGKSGSVVAALSATFADNGHGPEWMDEVTLTKQGSRKRFLDTLCGLVDLDVHALEQALVAMTAEIQAWARTHPESPSGRDRDDRDAAPPPTLTEAEIAALKAKVAPILAAPDPVRLVVEEFGRIGYGGHRGAPLIVYLAMTSRVLGMRLGTMPVHLCLLGPPSVGKSYAERIASRLLPPGGDPPVRRGLAAGPDL